ncbi:MAG: VanW family protein [Coriobacteriia bacterium]|nr:VanW family protein [Coriobacteriia bacterium]
MQLSDQELLKRVLYEGRHDDGEEISQDMQAQKSAAEQRKKLIQKEKKKTRRRGFLRVAVPLMIVFLLLGGALAFEYLSSWDRVHRNVVVAGIEIGGKTPDEAKVYLNDRLATYAETPVSIQFVPEDEEDAGELAIEADSEDAEGSYEEGENGYNWMLLAEDIGLSFDTTEAVDLAYSFGRGGSVLDDFYDRFMSYFEAHRVGLQFSYNEELAAENFEPVREIVNLEPTDSRVVLEDGTFVVDSGSDGIVLGESELVDLIAEAVLLQNYDIETVLEAYPRYIDDENAQRAANTANDAIELPVDVNYGERNWTFEPADVAQLIEFKRSDRVEDDDILLASREPAPSAEHSLETFISTDEVSERVIGRLGTDVGSSPRDAQFTVSGDSVTIQPSITGSGVDAQQLTLDLSQALMNVSPEQRSVEVTLRDISPRRTTEDAEAMGINERIGGYTTNFSLGNAPRLHNIQLMARMLDGIIVAPGEEFSINGATGYRTAADGFQAAGVIVQGEMSTAVGGGICQVSTTMFNAAMSTGFQITQRINHSVFLSSYNPGKDAAIAAHGPDFRFRNTLDSHVLISTSSTDSSITISFFGTDPGYDIDIRTGTFTRSDFSTTEIRDSAIPRGERRVERAGQRGGTVNVYYTVRSGDRVVREQTFTSRYRTVDQIVRIGTGSD